MAITAALVTALGGGKSWSAQFDGSGNITKTVGETGKNYTITYRFSSSSPSDSLAANGTTLTIDTTEGFQVFPGPVTITYTGTRSSASASVHITETTPV